MMRYQRHSPDCLPLPTATTGRKSELPSHPNPTLTSGSPNANQGKVSPNSEAKSLRGVKSTSDAPSTSTSPNHGEINGGDLLLQWGHNKRTRGPRTSQAGDDSASSHLRSSKIQRRSSVGTATAEKLMPPPQLPVGSYTRGANLRSAASLPNHHRAVEEHHHRSRGEKRSTLSEKNHYKSNGHHHPEGGANPADIKQHQPSDHDLMATSNGNGGEKGGLEHFEWPRIYISLSRKEKEDDFLAMKGTKLPQRPKKRAKNVDKSLQYVFPGMWLSDLTKGRYEVREKKCVKKKRRGLKGMENLDSDSE